MVSLKPISEQLSEMNCWDALTKVPSDALAKSLFLTLTFLLVQDPRIKDACALWCQASDS